MLCPLDSSYWVWSLPHLLRHSELQQTGGSSFIPPPSLKVVKHFPSSLSEWHSLRIPWLLCAAARTLSLFLSCFTALQEQATFGWAMANSKPVWKQEEPLTGCPGMGIMICKQEIFHIRNGNRFCAGRSHCLVLISYLHTSSWGGTWCGVGHETWSEESRGANFCCLLTSSPN